MALEHRSFGNTDMRVSALGFGGAEIGYQKADLETVTALLNAALDAGLNVIDTAACYADSETLIGQAVGHRRDDFYLFTKCGHAAGLPYSDWDPRIIPESIDRSLRRLRTDRLDLVQIHTCAEDILRQGDLIAAVQKARDAGKTRYIGYSGDKGAALYAVESGVFDALQTSVSIADQQCITLTLPKAKEKNMGVIAKRPIANAVWRGAEPPKDGYTRPYWDRLQELKYDFLKQDDAVATALRFTLSVPGVSTAIVGTQNPSRWGANAKLLQAGKLPAETFDAIRARWNAVAKPDWTGRG